MIGAQTDPRNSAMTAPTATRAEAAIVTPTAFAMLAATTTQNAAGNTVANANPAKR